ncbi:hypothetical protein ISS86_00330, partial [Candidatus Microgenomates bacterium]|nr:hypothetical protein [Candidatus Microgenomates bacterium]
RARRKGLHIEKTNLENQVPKGELAVVWGVTHHLTNQKAFLEKVRSHFKYIIIREPIKNIWSFLDGGEPLTEKEWTDLFNETLGHYTLLKSKGCLFVFWKKQNSS